MFRKSDDKDERKQDIEEMKLREIEAYAQVKSNVEKMVESSETQRQQVKDSVYEKSKINLL